MFNIFLQKTLNGHGHTAQKQGNFSIRLLIRILRGPFRMKVDSSGVEMSFSGSKNGI